MSFIRLQGAFVVPRNVLGCRWLCGNTLASDANGPGSTAGGTSSLTQVSSFRGSVKCVAISKQWVTAVEDCGYILPGVALPLRV